MTSAHAMSRFDGCVEFDERLLEAAFAPTIDAELDKHLAHCDRCMRARDWYMTTADALSVALLGGESTHEHADRPTKRPARKAFTRSLLRSKLLVYAAAAASIMVAVWLARTSVLHPRDGSIVSKSDDARIEIVDTRHAVLQRGTVVLEIGDDESSVDTPLGTVRARDAKLRVSTAPKKSAPELSVNEAAFVVTIAVTSGLARWSSKDEQDVEIHAGETLVRPASESDQSIDHASGALIEPSSTHDRQRDAIAATSALPDGIDPTLAARRGYRILGRVIDRQTRLPIVGAHVHFVAWGKTDVAGPSKRESGIWVEASGLSEDNGLFFLRCNGVDVKTLCSENAIRASNRFLNGLVVTHDEYGSVRGPLGTPTLTLGVPFDFGEIPLDRGVQISGRVIDSRGRPVSGAILFAGNGGSAEGILTDAHEVGTSDASGQMRLHRLSSFDGTTLLAVSDRGMGWMDVPVREGGGDVPGMVLTLAPEAKLVVVVRDATGASVVGATVKLSPRFSPLNNAMEDQEDSPKGATRASSAFMGTTDAAGTVEFQHLPAPEGYGGYRLVVAHARHARAARVIDRLDEVPDATIEIVIDAYRTCAVSGRVTDASGAPIAGVAVQHKFTSDLDGRYRVTGLDPSRGEIRLSFAAPGFVEVVRPVTLPSTTDVDGVEVVLERPMPIDGRVVDERGQPIVGAKVFLRRGSRSLWSSTPDHLTDATGKFAFGDATAGEWSVDVLGPEPFEIWDQYRGPPLHGGDRAVDLVLRRALTPEKVGGARVVAEIIDADTGKPLEPIQAQVDSTDMRNPTPNPRPFGIELRSGSVSVDYVPPGSWTFWVSANARSDAYTPFRVRPDDKLIQLKIALGSPASVSGNIVFGGLEKPVSADVCGRLTQVSLHPGWVETSRIYPFAKLRDDGSFEFAKLIPGHWKISLLSPTLIAEAEIDLAPGRNGHVQLVAERAGVILFKTTPLADGFLDVVLVEPGMTGTPEELAGATRHAFPVAKDGFYAGSLPVRGGRYHWTARWLGAINGEDTPVSIEPQSGDVDVVAGERREIEVQLIRK